MTKKKDDLDFYSLRSQEKVFFLREYIPLKKEIIILLLLLRMHTGYDCATNFKQAPVNLTSHDTSDKHE